MTTIVTRAGKGSPLTHTEVDTNFVNLNTAKLETAAIPLGTLQAPSVSFLNDSDTGIFCPQGGNSLAIATGGQYAITCTSTQAVGIKTANPQKTLHVAGPTRVGADDATDAFLEIGEGATGNRTSYIDIVADTTYTDYGLRVIRNNTGANATSELKHRGTGALNITTQEAAAIEFYTTNSPRVAIDSSGRLLVGTSTSITALTKTIELHGAGDGAGLPAYQIYAYPGTVNTSAGHFDFFRSASSTLGANTLVGIDDRLGQTRFFGADGSTYIEAARIAAEVDGTPGASDMPGRLVFSTTADGGSSPTEAMRINSQQELLVGTATRNANGGVLQLKSGITFPATAVAATDVNTLDDYEEGTWTPSIGGTATYGYQTARYTKIGRMVYVSAIFAVNIIGTGSTSTISGLPFGGSSGNVGTEAGLSISYFANLASNVVSLSANANTGTNINFYGLTAAGAGATLISPFQNGTRIDFAGWYITA